MSVIRFDRIIWTVISSYINGTWYNTAVTYCCRRRVQLIVSVVSFADVEDSVQQQQSAMSSDEELTSPAASAMMVLARAGWAGWQRCQWHDVASRQGSANWLAGGGARRRVVQGVPSSGAVAAVAAHLLSAYVVTRSSLTTWWTSKIAHSTPVGPRRRRLCRLRRHFIVPYTARGTQNLCRIKFFRYWSC